MKTGILIVIFCASALAGRAADEPAYSASKVSALIDSLPTDAEKEEWGAYFAKPEAQRDKVDVKLARKIKGETGRYMQLYAQIKVGKSIFDYPGILALGRLHWHLGGQRTYNMMVGGIGSPSVGGFEIEFSETGVILHKGLDFITD